ncbi:unnamed protein product [Orchesella dallaii]|uniref:Hyaluronan/mRNA-binding protein domain-containing protein n=1 Tax=Orchesella dallaii TaxID=48710 RepID=A0ABP1QW86_9HEXA
MEVEYGVGITNRFSFLPEELEDQEAPIVPVKDIRPSEATKKGGKADVKPKKELKKEKELPPPPSTNRVVRKESSQKDDKKEPREKIGETRGTSSFRSGPRNFPNQFPKNDGQPPRRNFKPRNEPRNRENEGNESAQNPEAADGGVNENGMPEQPTNKREDGQKVDETCDDQEKENEEVGEKTPEKTITLKEWKALQAPREKPVFNIRRPGEGEDSSRLGKLIPKKKTDIEIVEQEEEYEIDDVYYPQRAGKFKQVADVGFTTGYQKRRGGRAGGRGGRFGGGDGRDTSSEENILADGGRGRSRGPRGAPRRGSPPIPRINDAMDFPSLG